MKKSALIVIAILIAINLSACSQKKEVSDTPDKIEQKFAEALGKDKYLCDTTMAKDTFYEFYGLDESQIESYVAKESSNPRENPDHVVVLKVKEGYSKSAVDLLNKAYAKIVESVRSSSSGLGKTLNAVIYEQDNYIAFILAGEKYEGDSSEEEVKTAKKDYETIENTWKEVFGSTPSNVAVIPPEK